MGQEVRRTRRPDLVQAKVGAVLWDLQFTRGSDGARTVIGVSNPFFEINPSANWCTSPVETNNWGQIKALYVADD